MTEDARAAGTVQSSEKLFRIVDGLRELDGAGVTELGDHVGLSKSLTHKYLKTLEQDHFVVNNDGEYELSFKFLTYGGYVRNNSDLCTLAEPKVRALAEQTDEMVMFIVKSHGRGIIVQTENEEYLFQEPLRIGAKLYLHLVAAGKAILADLPDEEIVEIMHGTDLSPGDEAWVPPEALLEELEAVRDRGYAFNIGDETAGINAVGCSVVDRQTGTVGGMSVAGPASRLTRERLETEFADAVLGVANELEFQLTQR